MKSTYQRFTLFERLVEEKTTKAKQQYATALQALEEKKKRLEELKRFRTDYHGLRADRGHAGVTGLQWSTLNQFLSNLESLYKQQQREIEFAQLQAEKAKSHWRRGEEELQNIEKMLQKQKQLRLKKEEKRSQQERDDQAATRVSRQPPL